MMARTKQSLEDSLQRKVRPVLQSSVDASNIDQQVLSLLENDLRKVVAQSRLDLRIHYELPFTAAKHQFKRDFLLQELSKHKANVSELARFVGIDRRTIHRIISAAEIESLRDVTLSPRVSEQRDLGKELYTQLRQSLEGKENLFRADRLGYLYHQLAGVSKDLGKQVQRLQSHGLTFAQALQEFEKRYLEHHLQEQGHKIALTAKHIGLRPETLSRKCAKLGI